MCDEDAQEEQRLLERSRTPQGIQDLSRGALVQALRAATMQQDPRAALGKLWTKIASQALEGCLQSQRLIADKTIPSLRSLDVSAVEAPAGGFSLTILPSQHPTIDVTPTDEVPPDE